MPWIILALLSLAGYAIWQNRAELSRSIVFEGLSRVLQNQLAEMDFTAAIPSPVTSYSVPLVGRTNLFIRSVVFHDPQVQIEATISGTFFVFSVENLSIDLATTGALQTSGRAMATHVEATGRLLISPDLFFAEAPVDTVEVSGFIVRLTHRDAFSLAMLAVTNVFQNELQAKLEAAIREMIETQVPRTIVDYASEHPMIAQGLVGITDVAT